MMKLKKIKKLTKGLKKLQIKRIGLKKNYKSKELRTNTQICPTKRIDLKS